MKDIFRFRNFPVYKDSKKFLILCYKSSDSISNPNLRSQIQRAANSIVLNIAEGSAKYSDKDFARYLASAIGSVNELIAAFDISLELNLIKSETFGKIEAHATKIVNQLASFRNSLKSKE